MTLIQMLAEIKELGEIVDEVKESGTCIAFDDGLAPITDDAEKSLLVDDVKDLPSVIESKEPDSPCVDLKNLLPVDEVKVTSLVEVEVKETTTGTVEIEELAKSNLEVSSDNVDSVEKEVDSCREMLLLQKTGLSTVQQGPSQCSNTLTTMDSQTSNELDIVKSTVIEQDQMHEVQDDLAPQVLDTAKQILGDKKLFISLQRNPVCEQLVCELNKYSVKRSVENVHPSDEDFSKRACSNEDSLVETDEHQFSSVLEIKELTNQPQLQRCLMNKFWLLMNMNQTLPMLK